MKKLFTFVFLVMVAMPTIALAADDKYPYWEIEDNNLSSKASSLTLGDFYRGHIASEGDVDWYAFTSEAKGDIKVRLNVPSYEDFDVEIYDASMNKVGDSTNSGATTEVIDLEKQAAGSYYIKVYGANGSVDSSDYYTLRADYNVQAVHYDDTFEPNDVYNNGYSLGSGEKIYQHISYMHDYDWYKIETDGKGDLRTVLNVPSYENFELEVYNADKELLQASRTNGANTEVIELAEQPRGIYYIRIVGNNSADSSDAYSLTADFVDEEMEMDLEAFESNDIYNNSIAVQPGVTTRTYISELTDVDWYEIQTVREGDIRVEMFVPSYEDFDIVLYDEARNKIDESTNSGSHSELLEAANQPEGTYYVKVFGNNSADSSDTYSFMADFVGKQPSTANDILHNSDILSNEAARIGHISHTLDADWYHFTTTGGEIGLTLDVPSYENYDIYLYNSNHQLIGSSRKEGSNQEAIQLTGNQPGDYYVEVRPVGSSADSSDAYYLNASYNADPNAGSHGSPVNISKDWTITYNTALDLNTASSSNIIVYDEEGNVAPVTVEAAQGNQLVVKAPEKGYRNATTYTMLISNHVSADGQKMAEPVTFTFTTR